MDEARFSRIGLDAAYASIGSLKLCNDASTCPGARQRHGAARQHGSQRLRKPLTAWSASRKCSLRRQYKAASHCVVVGFIWPCGQHETVGMQGRGKRGRTRRQALLGYGHRELRQLPQRPPRGGLSFEAQCPLLAQSGHADRAHECPLLAVKRTLRKPVRMSANDPKVTLILTSPKLHYVRSVMVNEIAQG